MFRTWYGAIRAGTLYTKLAKRRKRKSYAACGFIFHISYSILCLCFIFHILYFQKKVIKRKSYTAWPKFSYTFSVFLWNMKQSSGWSKAECYFLASRKHPNFVFQSLFSVGFLEEAGAFCSGLIFSKENYFLSLSARGLQLWVGTSLQFWRYLQAISILQ